VVPVYVTQASQRKTSQEDKYACSQDEQLGINPTGMPPITRGFDAVSARAGRDLTCQVD
jgi:hypothetical protein